MAGEETACVAYALGPGITMIVVDGAVGCAVGTATGARMGVTCMCGVVFSMRARNCAVCQWDHSTGDQWLCRSLQWQADGYGRTQSRRHHTSLCAGCTDG